MFTESFKELFAINESVMKGIKQPSFPRYNISEEADGSTVLEMSCAGFDREAFEVTLDKGLLYVSGSPLEDNCSIGKDYLVRNLSSKDFKFAFPLWIFGEIKDIDCSYKDGMFKVLMKKKQEEKINITFDK